MIRITSKKNGFRRCGVEHPSSPTLYSDDHFTKEQLKQLEDEPMLIVDVLEDQQEQEELSQLRERAKELGIPRASQLGEEKLTKAIAEKEAELEKELNAAKVPESLTPAKEEN